MLIVIVIVIVIMIVECGFWTLCLNLKNENIILNSRNDMCRTKCNLLIFIVKVVDVLIESHHSNFMERELGLWPNESWIQWIEAKLKQNNLHMRQTKFNQERTSKTKTKTKQNKTKHCKHKTFAKNIHAESAMCGSRI
jgi:hypothetical protein